tara:strand:- start:171 stop:608 length:438 start_codon:yes stop_codon:yes gene_type:complete
MKSLSDLQKEFEQVAGNLKDTDNPPSWPNPMQERKKYIPPPKSKKRRADGNSVCTFKLPVKISDEMCAFLGLEDGTMIPRTEVTKMLCQWVRDNDVKSRIDSRCIDINCKAAAPLKRLMKKIEKRDLQKFTLFIMQKYIQHHYIK